MCGQNVENNLQLQNILYFLQFWIKSEMKAKNLLQPKTLWNNYSITQINTS